MGILNILTHNFHTPSRTRKPPDTVPYPDGFRGSLQHQLSLCVGCGTCSYVCSPGAIVIERENQQIHWRYDAGRCTFCGRCVDYCPTDTLTFANHASAITTNRSQQITVHTVQLCPCENCGTPIVPLPPETLLALYHDPAGAAQAAPMHRLCERCRARQISQQIKSGMRGGKEVDPSQER
jgi:formate hydrogenlyase subunit 6/NADH:ubiquinone oxidoreductase subunit I